MAIEARTDLLEEVNKMLAGSTIVVLLLTVFWVIGASMTVDALKHSPVEHWVVLNMIAAIVVLVLVILSVLSYMEFLMFAEFLRDTSFHMLFALAAVCGIVYGAFMSVFSKYAKELTESQKFVQYGALGLSGCGLLYLAFHAFKLPRHNVAPPIFAE